LSGKDEEDTKTKGFGNSFSKWNVVHHEDTKNTKILSSYFIEKLRALPVFVVPIKL